MLKREVEVELSARARGELRQRRLCVDYYRIRRQVAFPLGVQSLPRLSYPPEADNFAYPWVTWYAWRLEDRLHALGGWGEQGGDEACRRAAAAELAALADWPHFNQYDGPDLSSGHLIRLLTTALRQWSWLGEPLRAAIAAACVRQIERVEPWYAQHRADLRTAAQLLAHPNRSRLLHNIPAIGTFALADAATAIGHAAADMLNAQAIMLFDALLEMRLQGHTEAVAYDGYLLDFALAWLTNQPREVAQRVIAHAAFGPWARQAADLSLPGNAMEVPLLGDVEPRQMPFHFTASARALALADDPVLRWHLESASLPTMRADALAILLSLSPGATPHAPATGATRLHYAVTLRSGWGDDDLTLAASATVAQMGHIHFDAGSIVLAVGDQWIIDDPGYQQYLPKSERTFSIGAQSHNAPLIDGQAQSRKQPTVLTAESIDDQAWHAAIDLTGCYDEAVRVRRAVRHVWMLGRRAVVVADVVDAPDAEALSWHWHGHPSAAWWCEAGHALVQVEQRQIWVTCPGVALEQTMVDRQRGSRGHLTLSAHRPASAGVHWWVFSANEPVPCSVDADRHELNLNGRTLRV